MPPVKSSGHTSETSAHVILEVAKAISAHLELPDVLKALTAQLQPMVKFDAIGVVLLDGDYARLHSLHVEGIERKAGEPVHSILARSESDLNVEPLQARIPVSQHI